MQTLWRVFATAAGSAALLLLCGCGAAPSAATGTTGPTTPPATPTLSGNYLLAGALPLVGTGSGFDFFNLATTLDESNGVVTPFSSGNYRCPIPDSFNFDLAPATVGTNGAFTLTSPTTTFAGLEEYGITVTVTSSTTSPAEFQGTITTLNPMPMECSMSQVQNFGALKIADVTGTYAGTLPIVSTGGVTVTPTVTLTLQQGAKNPTTGVAEEFLVSGTISVQGSGGCASSGTTTTTGALSSIAGAVGTLIFQMSDGAVWNLTYGAVDSNFSSMNVLNVSSTGGSCSFGSLTSTAFTKQ